jgi:serine/threonine protein kinase
VSVNPGSRVLVWVRSLRAGATPRASDTAPVSACLDDSAIAELLDDQLDADARHEVDRHIEGCQACRKLVAELARGAPSPSLTAPPSHAPSTNAPERVSPDIEDLAHAFLPGARLGRYVVLSLVGMGGLGMVYEAYDPDLDRRVALKLLRERSPKGAERSKRADPNEPGAARSKRADPNEPGAENEPAGRDLLLREAQALAKLSHRNVVAVHDVGILGGCLLGGCRLCGRVFIAMEFVAGSTLRAWLGSERRGWRRVLEVFREAGQGLVAAHQAGLVHRDFKPDNVLVRSDGHACVTDFGLARVGVPGPARSKRADPDKDECGDRAASDAAMTADSEWGDLIGTPAYMAPELFASNPAADARSDQYAFCVSLFEALYGFRPFGGDTLADLRAAVTQGCVREAPVSTDVPAWLARAVMRGLSLDARDRFSSMSDLLAALREPRRPRARAAALAAAGVMTVAAIGGGVVARARAHDAPALPVCRGGDAKLGAVWSEAQRWSIEQAFAATGLPYEELAMRAVERGLDRFSRDWLAAYTEACEATRVRGEQSEQLLDERMVCLEQRRKEARAVVDEYLRADERAVERAVEAADAIPSPLTSCAAEALRGARAWPSDAAARAKLEAVQTGLAVAKARHHEGHDAEAADAAADALMRAKIAGSDELQCEAGVELAELEERLANRPACQRDALDAALLGQTANLDDCAARAWSLLVVAATKDSKLDEAHLYARLASAAIARLGGNARLEGHLLGETTLLLRAESKTAEALDAADRGLSLLARAEGDLSLDYLRALYDRAVILLDNGRFDESLADLRRYVGAATEMLGAEHPRTLDGRYALARALNALGRFDEACATVRPAPAPEERRPPTP